MYNKKVEVACLFDSLWSCKQIEHPYHPMLQKAIDAKILCREITSQYRSYNGLTKLWDCLLKWYEEEFKKKKNWWKGCIY